MSVCLCVCVCVLMSQRYEKRYPVCLSPKKYLPLQTTAGGRCVNDTPIIFFLLSISILGYEDNMKGTMRPQQVGGV